MKADITPVLGDLFMHLGRERRTLGARFAADVNHCTFTEVSAMTLTCVPKNFDILLEDH